MASATLTPTQSVRRERGCLTMASDQGLSIFDEPESGDDAAAPSGSTARGTAAEETQVLPVTPKDEPPAAAEDAPAKQAPPPSAPAQPAPAKQAPQPPASATETTRRSPVVPSAAPRPAAPGQ